MNVREIRHAHIFCGLGGAAKGFNKGEARVGNMTTKFRCLGGIDSDPAAIRDFSVQAGVPGTVLDLFSRDQYREFHDREPGPDWCEALPSDLHRAFGNERPHIVFLSAPCKGFSGLLPEKTSKTGKYQALNGLTLRGVWLMLEAYKDDPVELVVFENVPRIATRGRHLLDQTVALLEAYGYAVAETTHDCGELGGLAQSRKRFLLVARHIEKVPPFLYEPPKRSLLGVGEIIGKLPVPGPEMILPMHRMPSLQWKTWVRLAFVEAGSDWRSLNKLKVEDGILADFGIERSSEWRGDYLGVRPWDQPTGTLTSKSGATNGSYSVADPRRFEANRRGILGVRRWEDIGFTVTANGRPMAGTYSVADPRAQAFKGGYGVCEWGKFNGTVAGESLPSNGRFAVADPRAKDHGEFNRYGVGSLSDPAATITSQRSPGQGRFSVADPRIDGHPKSVQMGVRRWAETAPVITGQMVAGGGPNAVADPRLNEGRFNNIYRIVRFGDPSPSVTGGGGPSAGGLGVADPRAATGFGGKGKYRIAGFDQPAGTVIGASTTGQGAFALADPRCNWSPNAHRNKLGMVPWERSAGTVTGSRAPYSGGLSVADPRPGFTKDGRDVYITGGHYGVLKWGVSAGAVAATANHDNGRWSLADPRLIFATSNEEKNLKHLPEPTDRLVAVIEALDGTWHRPFTTLELAALQGLVDPDEVLELDGLSDSAWRERIGNAVPPPAAQAIASVMARTLLLAWSGETFMLSMESIWVRDVAVALTVNQQDAR